MADRTRPVVRRRSKQKERRIADDEFMAAAVGDVKWLGQSLKGKGQRVVFNKNVRTRCVCGGGKCMLGVACLSAFSFVCLFFFFVFDAVHEILTFQHRWQRMHKGEGGQAFQNHLFFCGLCAFQKQHSRHETLKT